MMARYRKKAEKYEKYVDKSNKERMSTMKGDVENAVRDLRMLNIVKYGDGESTKKVLMDIWGKAFDYGYGDREKDEEED